MMGFKKGGFINDFVEFHCIFKRFLKLVIKFHPYECRFIILEFVKYS